MNEDRYEILKIKSRGLEYAFRLRQEIWARRKLYYWTEHLRKQLWYCALAIYELKEESICPPSVR